MFTVKNATVIIIVAVAVVVAVNKQKRAIIFIAKLFYDFEFILFGRED